MPNFQYGIAGLAQGALSPNSKTISPTEQFIFSGRVKDIILDENHPDFKVYGEWASIGSILVEDISQPTSINPIAIARPLFPNIKQYPLINEVVVMLFLDFLRLLLLNKKVMSKLLQEVLIKSQMMELLLI